MIKADGVVWTYSRTVPYNGTLAFENGTLKSLARMERPYLVLDGDGLPEYVPTLYPWWQRVRVRVHVRGRSGGGATNVPCRRRRERWPVQGRYGTCS